MNGKPWKDSWTLVSNGVTLVASLGFWAYMGFDAEYASQVLVPAVIAVANIALRFRTTSPVALGETLQHVFRR